MTDEARQDRGRILAKQMETELQREAAVSAALSDAIVSQTSDTVTLRRRDYDALVRLVVDAQGRQR